MFRKIVPVFLFALFFQTGLALAQGGDFSQIDKIPSYAAELDPETFLAEGVVHKETPMNDKYLAYSVMLPEGWVKTESYSIDDSDKTDDDAVDDKYFMDEREEKKNEIFLSHRILGNIVTYRSSVTKMEEASRLYIKALALDSKIKARTWFLGYVLSNGYILKGLNLVSERRVEGLYVILEGHESFVVRQVVEINGPRAVSAFYYLPSYRFNKERALQQHVIGSFVLTSPEESLFSLERRTHNFLNLMRFDYPSSWRLSSVGMDNIDVMNVTLVNTSKEGILNGEIHFSAVSTEMDTTLSEEVAYVRESLQQKGLKIAQFVETMDHYKFEDHLYFKRVEVYKTKGIKKQVIDYEYWVAALEENRFYYVITMITPARETNFFKWLQNTEAFELVLETTRP